MTMGLGIVSVLLFALSVFMACGWQRALIQTAEHKNGKLNDIAKLLDNGWNVELFLNKLGSYTAVANNKATEVITDDFTPSDALYRLTEKATTGRIVPSGRVKSCDES